MERLTFEGRFCDIAKCTSVPGGSFCESGHCSQRKVWERLKAYEDIGADPEDINVQLEILRKYSEATDGIGLKRLRELAKAEKDGRLMVLPCKLGDVVYLLPASRNDGIRSVKVKRIEMTITRMERDLVLFIDLGDGRHETFRWASDKGRTWFSSKKEAEDALKKETEA